MNHTITRMAGAFALLAGAVSLKAQTTEGQTTESIVKLEKFVLDEKAVDPMGILPNAEGGSVFGLGLKPVDTPRSISMVTAEMIDLFDIDDINDLVSLTSGTYTSSFFGVAGALDIRGAPGETFFRGMKRIKNPGNFPTPIGASDRIDIVKGPPSPIFGPGPIGGYLNFIPKSSRASTGKYMTDSSGKMSLTLGSWGKRVATAETGGPATIAGQKGGYYAYVLAENSDSFYENSYQDQLIAQTSFDFDLTDSVRVQFGGQYHYYGGTENAGWNRLTQDLIDNHNYITGSPSNIDTDGDGAISRAEIGAAGVNRFIPYGTHPVLPATFALVNPGVTKLSRSQALIAAGDKVDSDSLGLFFDVIKTFSPTATVTNKIFVDYLDRYKYAGYGFSQKQEATTFENKVVADFVLEPSSNFKISNTVAGSYYWNKANGRSDTASEIFDRRDISKPSSSIDKMHHSVLRPDLKSWDNDVTSVYTDLSLGLVSDVAFRERTHLILGGRYDYLPSIKSRNNGAGGGLARLGYVRGDNVSNSDSGASWNISLAQNLVVKKGVIDVLTAYVTRAHQSLLSSGQAGELAVGPVIAGPLDGTELKEAGLKAELLKGKLYFASAYYDQTRSGVSDAAVDLTVTATRSRGGELEIRYVPVKDLSIALAANWQKTIYTPVTLAQPGSVALAVNAGVQFANAATAGYAPGATYGGVIITSIPAAVAANYEERAGSPDKVISLTTAYTFAKKWTATLSGTYQASVAADRLRTIILPEATVFNGSLGYAAGPWHFKVSATNITDEWYYRSNFPDIFGGAVVLPMPERGYEFSATFKF